MAASDVLNERPEVDTRHTEAEEAELRAHYEMLLPEATTAYVNWFLARTPAKWQEDMKDLIQEGLTEEIPAMIRNNLGAPPSQIVDVEAAAQAAAKSVGTEAADQVREKGFEVGSSNPANPRFPLVNIRPTETGPEIVGSADDAERDARGNLTGRRGSTEGTVSGNEAPAYEQRHEGILSTGQVNYGEGVTGPGNETRRD